jgi:2'-5' RNA ligase
MPETTRTFIALPLSESVQRALADIHDRLPAGGDIKWVKPVNIHLTLKFLGDLKTPRLKDVLHAFPALYPQRNSFTVKITRLGIFPPMGHPRIIWAGVTENAKDIQQLADDTERGMAAIGFPKETRAFQSHITLGRVRSERRLTQLVEAAPSLAFPPLTQPIRQIVLFKSVLTPQGPIYEPLATAKLQDQRHNASYSDGNL